MMQNYENQLRWLLLKNIFPGGFYFKVVCVLTVRIFGCASLRKIYFSFKHSQNETSHYFSPGESCFLFEELWTPVCHNSP